MSRGLFSAGPSVRAALATGSLLLATLVSLPANSQESGTPAPAPAAQSGAPAKPKPDAKRAKDSFKQGLIAEKQLDWTAAYRAFTEAAALDPSNRTYPLHREAARARLAQAKANAAERDAVSGNLDAALRELDEAHLLDPTNTTITER